MTWQTDQMRDYIFPLVTTVPDPNDERSRRKDAFLGTGFVIGSRGFGLTAAHVVRGVENASALFIPNKSDKLWHGLSLLDVELHPTEDVAVVRFGEGTWRSIFNLSTSHVAASAEYFSFGYPLDCFYENLEHRAPNGAYFGRPDLVFTKGYCRRRLTFDLRIPNVCGVSFIELSAVAGSGYSGSPILRPTNPGGRYEVIGIYVGERLTEDRVTSVAYALRADALLDWQPRLLGRSLKEEMLS
ncbi:hypothetical protein FHW12_003124 [Dokdonella fugitiva]|uniref:Trypsin-like peptidase n=1 Tax=Dokdonella fugitiva TaxID=328517 RepID=A0A839F5R8_9GAMM|nr:serine protease [Dokdonella fugitiva]MBA8888888.1 hypothetical protein [Dokdonella fugitiva]